MAFNLFKKKNPLDYPEEKASVLDQPMEGAPAMEPLHQYAPEQEGQLPPPPQDYGAEEQAVPETAQQPTTQEPEHDFNSGFKSAEDLRPPVMPPHEMREAMSASIEPPKEEHFMPSMTMPPMSEMREGVFGTKRFKSAPHIYIRVNKYQEVMEAVNELHRKIITAKEDLEDLHEINKEESGKLKDAAEVVLKIEDLLRYLETTFTSPEM